MEIHKTFPLALFRWTFELYFAPNRDEKDKLAFFENVPAAYQPTQFGIEHKLGIGITITLP